MGAKTFRSLRRGAWPLYCYPTLEHAGLEHSAFSKARLLISSGGFVSILLIRIYTTGHLW